MRHMMKWGILCCALLALAGCGNQGQAALQVETNTVDTVADLKAYGRVAADQQVLHTSVPLQVKAWKGKAGDVIEGGQVLAELDFDVIEQSMETIRQEIRTLESQARAKGVTLAESVSFDEKAYVSSQLIETRSEMQTLKMKIEKQIDEVGRLEQLVSTGAVQRQAVTDAKSTLQSLRQQLVYAQESEAAQLRAITAALEQLRVKWSAAVGELARLQAGAEALGYPETQWVWQGQAIILDQLYGTDGAVLPAQSALLSYIPKAQSYIRADISETMMAGIRQGGTVKITSVRNPDQTFTGTVHRISSLTEQIKGDAVVTVEIAYDTLEWDLSPGANVDLVFVLGE